MCLCEADAALWQSTIEGDGESTIRQVHVGVITYMERVSSGPHGRHSWIWKKAQEVILFENLKDSSSEIRLFLSLRRKPYMFFHS